MKTINCSHCGTEWYPQRLAFCPRCLASQWLSAPHLISCSQNQTAWIGEDPWILSVFSTEMLDDEGVFLFYAAANGTPYFHPGSQSHCYFVSAPLGILPGIAIPVFEPAPTYARSRLIIMDAFGSDPRAYTCDQAEFAVAVASGLLEPCLDCEIPGCENLRLPTGKRCLQHNHS